jgi:putative DNA methylase
MTQPKKLIEVAMPIKEISAESVRDKSIRHGHISTLHLWWARRPLPVCRAVVFASLVPDPLDENCPQAFRDAVEELLGAKNNWGDPYKPYEDIPYTTIDDAMEDNLRNRLLMFIGKFSDAYIANEKTGKTTAAKDALSAASLIKWDNKNDEEIIGKARKLIWAAHNAKNGATATDLLIDFQKHYQAIKDAEKDLYMTADRHLETDDVRRKEANLKDAIEAFLDKMPRVFDPFAGGGAIPLEASRLGCRSYGNDINPVAHIIQKGSLEFPQKYGKPIVYSREEFIKRYGEEELKRVSAENSLYAGGDKVKIDNRLSFDVEFYARELLRRAEEEIGHFYPADDKGKKPIAYYWARVGTCSNPSCRAEVPLLKGFYLANTTNKQIYLKPIIDGNKIDFEIGKGKFDAEGWMARGNLKCPCCGNVTNVNDLKQQFKNAETSERMLAVIWEGQNGKEYRLPTDADLTVISKIPTNIERPSEAMPVKYTQALPSCTWGLGRWGDMFSSRQILAMQTLVQKLNEIKFEIGIESDYGKAVIAYLGILIDRASAISTSFGRWDVTRENVQSPFSKQAIPMILDYPESNLFGKTTGSALNQVDWLTRYIESESSNSISTVLKNASSGDKEQFQEKFLTAVVTDPPYYDAIAYADLSDFFYVWLKRNLGDVFPVNFATPQTPKTDECTALKHHHESNIEKAKQHFENKLLQIFDAIEHQTSEVVSIMFAHQSTEAWTTLCNSILGARLNITGSWAIDSEMANRTRAIDSAALASSVTVSCKPANRSGFGDYKEVKRAIEKKVEEEVAELYALGFRGADLLTACFGKAVGEFGKYERVEKASGDEVTVAELLEMTRESAFNALLKGFQGDDFTKFYIGWLELYGFSESDFDDAAKFSRVGLSINVADLFAHDIFVKNGNKQSLADAVHRNTKIKRLGETADASLIDQVHKAMWLYKGANRRALLDFIGRVAAQPDSSFWRVLTSLDELLPKGIDDQKQVAGLLENKDNLIRESQASRESAEQQGLFG